VQRDLIVVGGGPVGASLARAARGLEVTLVAHERPAAPPREGFDARVYALSPGNVAFLQGLGAWPQERVVPVHAMRIFGDAPGAELAFDAYEAGVPALAWIVEDSRLQQALWRDLEVVEAGIKRIDVGGDAATLELAQGPVLSSKLVVGADGANSFVRAQAGIAARERDYGQSALVANFRCEKAHRNVAYQWFQLGAVLALLPLPGDHVSMVWSRPTEPSDLAQEVEVASRGVLGQLEPVSAPRSYRLRRLASERMVQPRIALAGDAAHVIHPLAGQGLNLGLQDARALAQVLGEREPSRDAGDLRLLRRYERLRAEPILAMDTMVDTLFRLFGADHAAAGRLRNAGLNLTDRLPVVKNLLMRHAMA
jgi:ubiquinone biosynthesis UbiH/UbiF/VisC/COQ6 family hydroxylase